MPDCPIKVIKVANLRCYLTEIEYHERCDINSRGEMVNENILEI